jgi:hypothetical protein
MYFTKVIFKIAKIKSSYGFISYSSNLLIDDTCLESLWNLCQPSNKGISYEIFLQRFTLEKSSNQCRILNYTTRICHVVKDCWENLKNEFSYVNSFISKTHHFSVM